MNLLINRDCNTTCDFCFHGEGYLNKKDVKNEMSLTDVQRLLNWGGVSSGQLGLLGGEPTMHSQFNEIVNLCKQYTSNIGVMTNLLCDFETLKFMVRNHLTILINIKTLKGHTQQARIEKSLQYLNDNSYPWGMAYSVVEEDEDLSLGYEIIKKYKPVTVRFAAACPGRKFSNTFDLSFKEGFGRKVAEAAHITRNINPLIVQPAECALPGCFTSEYDFNKLVKITTGSPVIHRTTNCAGNFDIYPDLHTHWCPATEDHPDLKVDNVFEYESFAHLEYSLTNKYHKALHDMGPQCAVKDYECNKDFCRSPCLGYNMALENQNKIRSIEVATIGV